ncbi:MAG: replicative DNA helicase [Myxococcales bacterium]|nr:replicative DNA helicase [Myxococcales bacterium]
MSDRVPIDEIFSRKKESESSLGFASMDEVLGKHRPPQSFDAEKGILCSILIDPDAMELVRGESLTAKDFHHPHHQSIYEAMLALYEKNEPIDTVTVANYLMVHGQLANIGAHTLSVIEEFLPTAAAVQSYVRLVKGKSALRRLISAAKTITEKAYAQTQEVSEVLDEAEQTIMSIRESTAKKGIISLKDLSKIAVEKYMALIENKNAITGVPSGFYDLDKLTAGFHPGELVIIAARPSMGKTAFVLNVASHISIEDKRPVAFFSLEMGAEQLFSRLIGAYAEIDLSQLRSGFIKAQDYNRLTQAAGHLAEAPMFIDETASLSIGDLRNKARRLVHQHGVRMIIIDYLQLMTAPNRFESKAVEVGEISKGLKSIARELSIPVIALSQLNRGVESRVDKRPMMSDLRESGAIEQDADVIAFLYREEYYLRDKTPEDQKNVAQLIIGKNRNGPTGQVSLRFDNKYTKFSNLSQQRTDS